MPGPAGYQVDQAQGTYWDPYAYDAANGKIGMWVPFDTPPAKRPANATVGYGATTGFSGQPLSAMPSPQVNTLDPGFLQQPDFFQNIYEKQMGIPTTGRTPYHKWLAGQWQNPYMAYMLAGQGVGTDQPYAGTMEDFIKGYGSPSRIPASYGAAFAGMEPGMQRDLSGLVGIGQQDLATYASLAQLGQKYAPWAAERRTAQMVSPEESRAYEISPGAASGEDSFFNYLRQKYGF